MRKYLRCQPSPNPIRLHSLSSFLSACHVYQLIMHVPLCPLVHTLVDLIDEREGCSGHTGQGHEVSDGSEGTFLVISGTARAAKHKQELTPPDCLVPVRTSSLSPSL